jgi:hypothetical protein
MRLPYNRGVRTLALSLLLAAAPTLCAQQPPTTTAPDQPQVRVNILNVCTPSDAEKQLMTDALKNLPARGGFSSDFEIARGRSAFPDQPVADWVRVRREFPPSSPYLSVQYTFSRDSEEMLETLVFRIRDPKDVLQVAISDRASSTAASPTVLLSTDTPANHVKVERFGKPSVALARCQADQSAYEPLFKSASEILAHYRDLLGVRSIVPADLARLGFPTRVKGNRPKPNTASPKPPAAAPPQKP